MKPIAPYERLAALFEYPTHDFPTLVRDAYESLAGRYPAAAEELESFTSALSIEEPLSEKALDELQEIFTRSFDVQAITTLSVGYLVFGDDYKRAELLVNLNREHHDAGIDCGSELPDHLPNVLRLMARWHDQDLVAELVEEILRPALRQMIGEFDPQQMRQRNKLYRKHFRTLIASSAERGTIYRKPLAALAAVLDADFRLRERPTRHKNGDFLRSIEQELTIEADGDQPTEELVQLRSMP